MPTLNAKDKTLLFVALLVTMFALLFTAVFYSHKKQELAETEKSYLKTVRSTYNKILNKQNHFYQTRALANISSDGVKEALFARDKNRLFELTKGRWKTLKSSSKFLYMMNFYCEDGSLLLAMDNPQKVETSRSLHIQKAIKSSKPFYGFVLNGERLEYHVSIPVIFKDHTVGVLEFVALPDEIFSEMEYINELKGALFVKSNTKKPSHIDGYALQYNSFEAIEIMSELKKNSYRFEPLKHYEFGENQYAFYAFDIADFSGRSAAKAVFINDITKINHKFNVDLVGIVVILVFLLIVLVATIHLGFKKIIERLDEALSESEKANKKLLHYVDLIDKNVITSTTNLQSTILSVSSAFCEISGYTKEELIGQNHRIVRHPDMPKSLYVDMWKTLSSDQVWQGEIKNKNKAGNYYWVFSTIYPIFNDAGKKIGYTAIRHDITDKKRVEELSITDGLTAIYNRRYFDQIFPKFLNSVKRNNDFVCFYMIDVDYFKLYNDNYGHQAGDDVLVQIASVMRNSLRRSDDYCFRLGGEEFGILMRVTDEDSVCDFGEKLRLAVEALAIPHKGNSSSPYVTISMGQYCSFGVDIESREQLYKRSDDLLYQAKQEGRNQLRCSKQQ